MTKPLRPVEPTRILLGGGTATLFGLSPLFVALGWFLWAIQHQRQADWAVVQTAVGTALFWIGVAMFFSACTIAAVRRIAQKQLDILLEAQRGAAVTAGDVRGAGPSAGD